MTIRQVLMRFQDKNDLKPDFEQEWQNYQHRLWKHDIRQISAPGAYFVILHKKRSLLVVFKFFLLKTTCLLANIKRSLNFETETT